MDGISTKINNVVGGFSDIAASNLSKHYITFVNRLYTYFSQYRKKNNDKYGNHCLVCRTQIIISKPHSKSVPLSKRIQTF